MSKIESGSRKVTIDEVKKLAILFGVMPNYLLGFHTGENAFRESPLDLQALIESKEHVYYAEELLSQSDKIIISNLIDGYLMSKGKLSKNNYHY